MRSSFSQHSMFERCNRQWYYRYVLKIPVVSDMSYADAGTIIHKCLEKYYKKEVIELEKLKETFDKLWEKYKLDKSIIAIKKESYWLMILNGIKLNKHVTSTELKIFYPEVVCYIDVVDSDSDVITDWKSSTRTANNEEEYKKQLLVYSWLYYRKLGRLPQKAVVEYLKYSGTKGTLVIEPTFEDIDKTKNWYERVLVKMGEVKDAGKLPGKCAQCDYWCPFKSVCNAEKDSTNFSLHLSGNNIYIDGPITEILNRQLTRKFSYELKNAYWMKKNNPYARTTVEFWNFRMRTIPIGFYYGLLKTLNDYIVYKKSDSKIEIKDDRCFDDTKVKMPDKIIGKELREYQQTAVNDFMVKKLGILQLGTGAGKTLIAAECIRRLGVKTLFVVDRKELLQQTRNVFGSVLGIPIGQLGGGIEKIEAVTVATIQFINKNIGKLLKYLGSVRFSVLDECHKISADSYMRLGHYLKNTEYRLGISATARRDDGEDMKITSSVGYILYSLSARELIEKGWLVEPKIIFYKDFMTREQVKELEQSTKTGLINESDNYLELYKVMISENVLRNNLIRDVVQKHNGKKILLLTKLVDHGVLLTNMINGSKHLHGSTPKEEREQTFKDFTEGNLNILVSTMSIFSEGVDVPALDVLINCAGNKGEIKTLQSLGRTLRKNEGKKIATYIDFMDDSRMFRLASLARKRAFVKEEHKVKIIDSHNI